jgi:Tfp pilus assembly protein PilN
VERVGFAAETVGRFISNLFKLSTNNFPVGLLYRDSAFSYFNILFRGNSIFVRSIPIGTQHFTSDYSNYLYRFVEEVRKSLEVYRGEDIDEMPQRIIFLTNDESDKDITESLCDSVGITTESVSLTGRLLLKNKVKEMFSSTDISPFLRIISASYESKSLKINLLPEEIKLKKAFEEKSREIIWTGVFSLSLVILIFVFFASKITLESIYLEQLKKRAKSINKESEQLENKFRRIQLVKNYLALRGFSLEILDKIYKNIPEKMRISEIRFDHGKELLSIKGTADRMTTIYSFVDSMSNEDYFKDVKTKYTTKRKEEDKDVADFELTITLEDKVK